MGQAAAVAASPKREHCLHSELEIVEASARRVNELGIVHEEPSVRIRWVAPHRPPQDLPQVGPGQFIRNATRRRGHYERPQVGPVTGFVDANDPWHAAKLSHGTVDRPWLGLVS